MTPVRVAVLGPGRVGTTLAMALPRPAYAVVAVAGRAPGAAEDFRPAVPGAVERFLHAVPGAAALPAAQATRSADLVLVTVPDDQLTTVVRSLAADGVAEGSRWVHTAGGLDHTVLAPVRAAGARVAACHPAQTFPDPPTALAALPGTAWAVTAEPGDRGWAGDLVADLGGTPITVRAADRVLYHAGLVVGSNGTAAVVSLARDLLLGAGVADPAAFLTPLVTASASNAAARGAAALTGPVRRGDVGTVRRHLAELAVALPEALDAYRALARLALGYARRGGLDPQRAAAVEQALQA